MTQPNVSSAGQVGPNVTAGVEALIDMARRLGLIWRLVPGTVDTQPVTPTNISVVMDNDTVAMPTISLIGLVPAGVRVEVLVVPPQGNYIIGYLNVVDSSSQQDEEADAITTGSTSYTASTPVCGVAFIVPPSGKVWIHWHAEMQNNTTAAAFCLASFEVREGSTVNAGTVVLAGSDNRRLLQRGTVANADTQGYGSSYLVTGLTPHASYNVVHLVRVTAGTGQFGARRIGTSPG